MGVTSEVILKCENVKKSYGKKEILKGVDLEIKSGEIYGLIGSSGSGKTTLLNTIIGFLPPTSGNIKFKSPHLLSYDDGDDSNYRNILKHPKDVKKVFGFAAQRPSVYGKLTLVENLDLFGSLYNLPKNARGTNTKILLKLMGLFENRKLTAESLSGGMMKRLDIACSLIHDPKILILDEPTADLDPYLRKQMWHLIRKINSKGTTIILSSHFLDELEELCDRIGIMTDGTIQVQGSPQQLKKQYQVGEQIHLTTQYGRYDILEQFLKKQKKLQIEKMEDYKTGFIVQTKKPLVVIQEIVKFTNKIMDPLLDLRMNRPSMNEIFSHLIEAKEEDEKEESKKKSLVKKIFKKK